ncbi:MAG: preprotein translocase subunit SecY [Candidatus Micrarchaeota archaeon]|mgnify:CR=1 FL=1
MYNFLKPIISNLPEVKAPLRAPGLKEKLMWTAGVLVLFFLLGQVYPYGAEKSIIQQFERFEILLGSRTGTLITTGIGPIVLASIFLQLAVGAKLINLDLSLPENKKTFQGIQKLLAIFLSLVEGFIYSKAIVVASDATTSALFAQNAMFGIITPLQLAVMFQLTMGSIILLYMDEVCQKYGIGSGVSLFIAAGVAQAIFVGTFGYFFLDWLGIVPSATSEPAGILPNTLFQLTAGRLDIAIWTVFPLMFTIIVFLIVVFAEGMKIELPLAYGGARGLGARYPIKFLYVSNIPVILASALLLNVQVIGLFMANSGFPLLGQFDKVSNRPLPGLDGGFAYLSSALPSPIFLTGGYATYVSQYLLNPTEILHILVYGIVLVTLCVIFGWFWIESTGMGAAKVAQQLKNTGLQIPGYRQDPRITEKILQKYIPIITVLGSIFVGVLAWFADITGALGTGTGILLTVGILYRFYEDLAQQQIFEMYPVLKRIAR